MCVCALQHELVPKTFPLPAATLIKNLGLTPELAIPISKIAFAKLGGPAKKAEWVRSVITRDRTPEATEISQAVFGELLPALPYLQLGAQLSQEFFMLFWALDLYDIFVPTQLYELRITELRQSMERGDRKNGIMTLI